MDTRRRWRDLSIGQKLAFVGKLVIFLITFGFIYPNLMDTEEQ